MKTKLMTRGEAAGAIESGRTMLLAGDESLLAELPAGSWIGGTIPYFIGEQGGVFTTDRVQGTEVPDSITEATIRTYGINDIHRVYEDGPANGFSVIILPASSDTHLRFALEAPTFPEFATHPLIGWISGVAVEDIGQRKAKVFDGTSGASHDNAAVVLHAALPPSLYTDIGIVNLFKQGDGDVIEFPADGFSARDASVNGRPVNFADYLTEQGVDLKLPLVADLHGAMINTSFQSIDADSRTVHFFAPVFAGIEYRIADAVADYVREFNQQVPAGAGDKLIFSCNCILNYLYAELEGRSTGDFRGPATFGEVAYQLLNQTMAYMTIEKA
jgi:hypothetical protein